MSKHAVLNALTIDVEEHFHATEVQEALATKSIPNLSSRVERQVNAVLELLGRTNTIATFFIVGSVAEEHPGAVRAIADAGHEIGCHSFAHRLVYDLTPPEFRADTERAAAAIEEASGTRPRLYRAPSYSITRQSFWALEVLAELGFTHDSSIYPIRHDRYGIPGFDRHASLIETLKGGILEVPIATAQLSSRTVAPIGGGGYMRLLPYCYTAGGIRRVNLEEEKPTCIYFHPWELDQNLPRLVQAGWSRFRTYGGLQTMKGKLTRLLNEFEFGPLTSAFPKASSPHLTRPALLTEAHLDRFTFLENLGPANKAG